jgi:hypothetical protein
MADKETRRGVGELTNLVGRMTQIREPSPQDTGAALIASFSQRASAIERRIQALEAKQ